MDQFDWLQIVKYQQELHRFSRKMLSIEQMQTLTSSERELLSLLYLYPNSTPLELSKYSGMKKEAVSRCLKHLYKKGCIEKEKHPQDERSYILSLTEMGTAELKKDYELLLKPFYDLRRTMGNDFNSLFELICKANSQISSD